MVRAYRPDPVAPDVLERVLGSARRAPSAGNSQGVELLVLVGPEETERYWALTLPRREGFRWQGLLSAPVLVVPLVQDGAYTARYAEPDKAGTGLHEENAWTVPYWWVDGGMAVLLVLLAAVDEGLGAAFFGLFEHEDEVLRSFGVPPDRRALGTIALGHPAPDQPGRSASRPRRSLDDIVHRGHW